MKVIRLLGGTRLTAVPLIVTVRSFTALPQTGYCPFCTSASKAAGDAQH